MRTWVIAVVVSMAAVAWAGERDWNAGYVIDSWCVEDPTLANGSARCTHVVDFGCHLRYRIVWDMPEAESVAYVNDFYLALEVEQVTACVGTYGVEYRAACECLVAQENSCDGVAADALDICGFR